METGTQILVERMKTHPEEFIEGHISKWARVMHMANDCLPDEDKAALREAYGQAKIDHFNEQVLKTLAGEVDSEAEGTIRYQAKERYATGLTDPRGLFAGSNGTSAVGLMPSAFGAVPLSSQGTVTLTGSSS